jgi:hypothetical protein
MVKRISACPEAVQGTGGGLWPCKQVSGFYVEESEGFFSSSRSDDLSEIGEILSIACFFVESKGVIDGKFTSVDSC